MNPPIPLESSWLGRKGEHRFVDLCIDGELICNKSDMDLAGWDYIVDFSDYGNQNTSLDARVAAMSCRVQVKTIRHTTASVDLRLHMAERLAKDPKPSFVCVLKVDAHNNFSDAFLIPLLDDHLARVLKRLRMEEVGKGKDSLNKKWISFTPKASERIAKTGAGLREAIKAHCGSNIHKYIQEKRRQLEQLGFQERPLAMKVKFGDMDKDRFFDMILGVVKNVPVSRLEVSETRFGIELPKIPAADAILTIAPNALCKATIMVRISETQPPMVVQCEVFATPFYGGARRMHLRHPLFTFVFDFDKLDDARIGFESSAIDPACTIVEWLEFWRLIIALCAKKGVIEFWFDSLSKPFEIDLEKSGFNFRSQGYDPFFCSEIFERLKTILDRIGLSFVPKVTCKQVVSDYKNIVILSEFYAANQTTEFQVAAGEIIPAASLKSGKWIVTNAFSVGPLFIAYYGMADAQVVEIDGQHTLSFTGLVVKKSRIIEDESSGYNDFISEAHLKEGVENVLQLNKFSQISSDQTN
jgi:hypothetical protein